MIVRAFAGDSTMTSDRAITLQYSFCGDPVETRVPLSLLIGNQATMARFIGVAAGTVKKSGTRLGKFDELQVASEGTKTCLEVCSQVFKYPFDYFNLACICLCFFLPETHHVVPFYGDRQRIFRQSMECILD